MDEGSEEKERRIDTAYQNLKADLAKEKAEFAERAEELEADSQRMNLKITEFEKTKDETNATYAFFMTLAFFSLAQTHRLGQRMIRELEWVYEAQYGDLKNLITLSKSLPDRVHVDMEKELEHFSKRIEGGLMSEKDKALNKLLWEKLSDLGYDEGE